MEPVESTPVNDMIAALKVANDRVNALDKKENSIVKAVLQHALTGYDTVNYRLAPDGVMSAYIGDVRIFPDEYFFHDWMAFDSFMLCAEYDVWKPKFLGFGRKSVKQIKKVSRCASISKNKEKPTIEVKHRELRDVLEAQLKFERDKVWG